MTDKEFRKLDKRDLYELLLSKTKQAEELSQKIEKLEQRIKELEDVVDSRRVTLDITGEEAEVILSKVIGGKNETGKTDEPEESGESDKTDEPDESEKSEDDKKD